MRVFWREGEGRREGGLVGEVLELGAKRGGEGARGMERDGAWDGERWRRGSGIGRELKLRLWSRGYGGRGWVTGKMGNGRG